MSFWSIISGVLGVLGFIISLAVFIRQSKRINMTLVSGYFSSDNSPRYILCEIIISNYSTLPISILNLSLSDGIIKPIPCLLHKKFVSQTTRRSGDKVLNNDIEFSGIPPFEIGSHGSYRATFVFAFGSGAIPYPIDHIDRRTDFWEITAQTTRGKIKCRVLPPTSEEFINHQVPNPYV